MSELVTLARIDGIGVITVDNPPVNALSPGVPEGIVDCVEASIHDPSIDAMVLIGAGRGFIAGADIKHLGTPRNEKARSLRDVLERSPKPIVAAIHGHALGGGLETALACHYRIAARCAKVGLPEVLIGILPGAGGTQRLPRLTGPKVALDMIVTGRHVSAPEALSFGIVDDVVARDALQSAAVEFAKRVAKLVPPPKVRERDDRLALGDDESDLFDAMRKRIARRARNQRAPYACIEAVEAAVSMSFDEGMAKEQALFQELVNADEAKALRYAFFAEREARKVPGVAKDTPPRSIERIGIIGAGTMGGGIAMACANAGLAVSILEREPQAMQRGLDRVRANYETSVKRGSLSSDAMNSALSLISPVQEYEELASCNVVIEAVYEDMEVKKQVFTALDRALDGGCIIASNTSALDIDALAAMTSRPSDVIGTHFFSPANIMKLLEIVRGRDSSPDVIMTAMALGRRIGKTVAVCGNCYGFVANRSRGPFGAEAGHLLLEGALPEQVDRVMYEFGYPVGPFVVSDIAGIDVSYAVRHAKKEIDPDSYEPNPIADRLYELGRYGQKVGAGFYRYEEGDRTPHADALVYELIEQVANEQDIKRRAIDDEEILHRLLFASINEAARILQEGIAYRASDVDVMWLGGFNFPRYRGGLMYWADQVGVQHIYNQVLAWRQRYGKRWTAAPLLGELARTGRSFAEWSAQQ